MSVRTEIEPFLSDPFARTIFDGGLSSFNDTIKQETTNIDRIVHNYLKEDLQVTEIEQYRYALVDYKVNLYEKEKYMTEEEKLKIYDGSEEEIFCGRFPHLQYCGCKYPCAIILPYISPLEVIEGLYVGPIEAAFKLKELIKLNISHVINVSCTEYNRRINYFKYLDIYISEGHAENSIKFFKVTNRFIDEAFENGKAVFIHSSNGNSRCWVFVLAYLIGRKKMKYSKAIELVRSKFKHIEPNDNYLTQLKHYDLETNI